MQTNTSADAIQDPAPSASVHERTPVFQRAAVVVLFVVAGGSAGVLAKMADEAPALQWLGNLTSNLSIWILLVAVIAAFAPSAKTAALRSATSMAGMCVAYYAYASVALGFPPVQDATFWTIVALTMTPAGAALLWFARHVDRLWSAFLFGVVATSCLATGALRRLYLAMGNPSYFNVLRPVPAAFDVICALVITLLLLKTWRTRWIALAVTVALGSFAVFGLDILMDIIHTVL